MFSYFIAGILTGMFYMTAGMVLFFVGHAWYRFIKGQIEEIKENRND